MLPIQFIYMVYVWFQADPIQLKGMLTVLRMGCQGQGLDKVSLTTLAPASAKQVS